MQLKDFFSTVITTPSGYFCLSAADKAFNWEEFWFKWPEDQDKIIDQARKLASQRNVYWSAHLFEQPRSTKSNVLPTRTIQADLDEANALGFSIPPTVMVQTSPNRFQGYWILQDDNTNIEKEELERLSRKLTYSISQADRSGWTLGHRLRLPETFNYKYDIPQPVTIISTGVRRVELAQLELLPDVEQDDLILGDSEIEWLSTPHVDLSDRLPPQELIIRMFQESMISSSVRMKYSKEAPDRSEALWQLMQELFAAGLDRDSVYWLAYNSANNKFKYPRDLRKDVLRAERKRGMKVSTLRKQIEDIISDRNLGPTDNRLDKVTDIILKDMRSKGRFYHSDTDECLYCESETGIPGKIPSEEWATRCTIDYGINSSTQHYRYITHEVRAYIRSIEARTLVANLSYYDPSAKTVLLHSGGKDVYVVKPDSLSVITNGSSDVLFYYSKASEVFTLDRRTELPRKWYEILFDSGTYESGTTLDYVDNMNKKQALAILTAWFLFIILRKGFVTRPLLGLIGQPGSGKSALARMVYKVIYGQNRDVHAITNDSDYDLLASQYPMIAYDNVDEYSKWLADRLCTSISETEVQKRELFTDEGVITLRRQALIVLTSHDPKFIRADVADRLLAMTFRRRVKDDGTEDFGDEVVIMGMLARYRNALWADIVSDLQKVLDTPRPDPSDVPNYRIKDFATAGVWITRALGLEQDFVKGIIANKSRQTNLVLEQESLLIQVLEQWVEAHPDEGFVLVSKLWNDIVGLGISADAANFQKLYRSSTVFGNRLYILHHNLKTQFDIDYQRHPKYEARVWRIKPKGSTS